jgi:peptide alpha-N-acetyltransferase
MRLYERLGFLRSKKLHRYYLNGNSAYRLVLLLKPTDLDASTDFALDEDDLAPR